MNTLSEIWETVYRCKVPLLAVTSTEHLTMFGSYITTHPTVDETLMDQYTEVSIPINDMVEYYGQGHLVELLEYTDVVKIYDVVSTHMFNWKHSMETSINVTSAPIEDLILMDEFATELFTYAKRQISDEAFGNTPVISTIFDTPPTNPLQLKQHLPSRPDDVTRIALSNFFKSFRTTTRA